MLQKVWFLHFGILSCYRLIAVYRAYLYRCSGLESTLIAGQNLLKKKFEWKLNT